MVQNDRKSPLVSVLMPAYNVAAYVGAAIESILAQTQGDFELLIQDDGSRDDTREIAAGFAARDARVRLLPDFPQNRGVVAARNALLSAARGEYWAWMDADDVSLPERLERQLAFLRDNPTVAAVGTAIALADEELYVYDAQHFPTDVERQRNDPYIACQTIMVRAEAARRAGGFRELFRLGGEDGDWLLRIADHADLTTLDDILYVYRMRGGLSQTNAPAIRRLGVIARAAATARRAGRPDLVDQVDADGTLSPISDAAMLALAEVPAQERADVLSVPLRDAPPLISVVLTVPRGTDVRALERCCTWLARQTFRNAEIIFVHPAGWTLPERCRSLLNDLPLTLLASDSSLLTRDMLARILATAKAPLIMWQDAANYPRETRLRSLVLSLMNFPDALAIGSAVNIVDEEHVLRSDTFDTEAFDGEVFRGHPESFGFRRAALEDFVANADSTAGSFSLEDLLRELSRKGRVLNSGEIELYAQYAIGATVSVLLDIDAAGPALERSLGSLEAQTMQDFEIVACFAPRLIAAGRRQAEQLLSRFTVHWVNAASASTVTERANALFNASRGRFVVWQIAGDVSAPNRFEAQARWLAAHPDCSAVGSGASVAGGREIVFAREALDQRCFSGFAESFMVRRRSAIQAGYLRRSLPLAYALQDFIERLAPAGSVQNIEEPLYRPHRPLRSPLAPCGAPLLRRVASMALFVAKSRRRIASGPRDSRTKPKPSAITPQSARPAEKPLLDVVLKETEAATAQSHEPTVAIARCHDNWYDFEDAIRYLTPGGLGIVQGVEFTRGDARVPDWQVVFNHPGSSAVRFEAPPERVLFAIGEPPTMPFRHLQLGQGRGTTVMTSDEKLAASRNSARRFVLTPCMTRTWSMKRPYDELKRTVVAEKPGRLSWVTSNLAMVAGHHKRLKFLETLRGQVDFDLYGRGFRPIPDKWQALAPYRYSIAFENSRERFYFTEKIMDCFVAETMPIYFGCPNILDFFPAESLVVIDPDAPDVFERIEEVVNSDLHLRNRDAIMEAKRLVLDEYNLFARLARFIRSAPPATSGPVPMVVHPIHLDFSDDGTTTPPVDFALPPR